MNATTASLDRLLDRVARCFTPKVARALLEVRADPELQVRIDELASRCNEGLLSQAERDEYEAYVRAINLITLLQSRARLLLARQKAS
jgi:hypothetical protein